MPYPPDGTELNWRIRNPHYHRQRSCMKIVSPQEAEQLFIKKNAPIIEALTRTLNEKATNSAGKTFYHYPKDEEYQFYNEIASLFNASGWAVENYSDQKDGTTWTFRPRAKTYTGEGDWRDR